MSRGIKVDHGKENVKSTRQGLKPGYNRVTYIFKDDIIDGIDYIVFKKNKFLKDVVNEALEQYIRNWEKENGRIQKR